MPSRFDFPKDKGLQTRSAIYVPSTKNIDEPISSSEHARRVSEVRRFLTKKFGGSTTDRVIGSFTDKRGKVVSENVAVVEHYTDFKDWKKVDQEIQKFVKKKAKEWGQESVSFEFEAPSKKKRLVFIEGIKSKKLSEIS